MNPNKLDILHISDLHIGIEDSKQDGIKQANSTREIIIENFFERLKEDAKGDLFRPSFIIVSGDIAWFAKKKEYEKFEREFANKFHEIYEHDFTFILCPGNHDKYLENKKLPNKTSQFIVDFNALLRKYFISSKKTKNNTRKPDIDKLLIIDKFEDMSASFLQFSNSCERISSLSFNFHDLEPNFLNGYHYYENLNLCFVSLNSAWNSAIKENKGDCVLGSDYVSSIHSSIKKIKKTNNLLIVITIVHHSPDYWRVDQLHGLQGQPCLYDEIIEFSDIILSGHEHGAVRSPDRISEKPLLIRCGSLYARDIGEYHKYHVNSFNKYSIDIHNRTIDIHPYNLDPMSENWIPKRHTKNNICPNNSYVKKFKDFTKPEILTVLEKNGEGKNYFTLISETICSLLRLDIQSVKVEEFEYFIVNDLYFLPIKADIKGIEQLFKTIQTSPTGLKKLILFDFNNESNDDLVYIWHSLDYFLSDYIMNGQIENFPYIVNVVTNK
jgi:DNA repair exonuclease SbcCD nuclease subunit